MDWAVLWTAGDFGRLKPLQVAVAPDGTIYVSGMFSAEVNAPIDFDPGPSTDSFASGGIEHIFVVRLDPSGAYLGTWTSSGSGTVTRTSLVVGVDGVLWLTGFLTGHPDLDPSPATHVLHAPQIPGTLQTEQVPWIATWSPSGEWRWGHVPEASNVGGIQPLPDGGAIYAGGYGGGATFADVPLDDLDPSPGLDLPPIGCAIAIGSTQCSAQGFWMRVRADGTPVWSNTFAQVLPDRQGAVPAVYGGTPLAAPDGSGILIGNWAGTVDFDWGPPRLEHSAPNHDQSTFPGEEVEPQTYDVFGAGFDPAGRFLGATPLRTLRALDTLADSRLTSAGYSARDKTFHAGGWVGGVLIGPAAVIGNSTRPYEGWLGAFDARGRPRWLAATGLPVGIGGTNAPGLLTGAGSTLLIGAFKGTADLDFTSGVHLATSETGAYYLVAFHEAPCAAGDTRPCDCNYEPDKVVTTGCEPNAPIFAACDCRDTGPRLDGTFAPPPTPDCGPCAAGWVCDPTTLVVRQPRAR